jgi:c(7)-type cytochrome triheme protein
MKRSLMFVLAAVLMLSFIGSVFAVGPGKDIVFEDGAMGKVTFSGDVHAKAGLKCGDCHPGLFQMKKGADKITMADHSNGKYCNTCHNGQKAFDIKGNCAKCHKK